jgi:hypothetical protein
MISRTSTTRPIIKPVDELFFAGAGGGASIGWAAPGADPSGDIGAGPGGGAKLGGALNCGAFPGGAIGGRFGAAEKAGGGGCAGAPGGVSGGSCGPPDCGAAAGPWNVPGSGGSWGDGVDAGGEAKDPAAGGPALLAGGGVNCLAGGAALLGGGARSSPLVGCTAPIGPTKLVSPADWYDCAARCAAGSSLAAGGAW